MPEDLKLAAAWTDDCNGKKDYDGDILSVSTRYWPAGGSGFTTMRAGDTVIITTDATGEPPSAQSRLILRHGDPEDRDYLVLVSQEFEGRTFEEVATQVEAWAQAQMNRVVRVLRAEFGETS